MKNLINLFLIIILFSNDFYSQEQRKVLVEVFTNSHCPLCPPGHNALESYNQNSPNADKINYIFYHMVYPYSDDALYSASESDSDGRDLYYGPFGSTPKAFFDGVIQQNNYSSWGNLLDQRVAVSSPLKIVLTGTKGSSNININAEIMRTGIISETDLVIHFVVIENIFYQGRNGITIHKNVMRKMISSPNGEPFTISENETKQVQKNINLVDYWIPDSLGIVVFIQSSASKAVYQSSYISYSELSDITGIDGSNETPSEYSLEQNYPNPFNPTTIISYSIPYQNFVALKIYDVLGNEVAILIEEEKPAGNYRISFDAANLSSGIYFYRFQTRDFVETKRMILIK